MGFEYNLSFTDEKGGKNSYSGKPIAIEKGTFHSVKSSGCFLSIGQMFKEKSRGMIDLKLTITHSNDEGEDTKDELTEEESETNGQETFSDYEATPIKFIFS